MDEMIHCLDKFEIDFMDICMIERNGARARQRQSENEEKQKNKKNINT